MIPNCPKCGTSARLVIVLKAKVRCVLNNDGSIGDVVSASRSRDSVLGYSCGGSHEWFPDSTPSEGENNGT